MLEEPWTPILTKKKKKKLWNEFCICSCQGQTQCRGKLLRNLFFWISLK